MQKLLENTIQYSCSIFAYLPTKILVLNIQFIMGNGITPFSEEI